MDYRLALLHPLTPLLTHVENSPYSKSYWANQSVAIKEHRSEVAANPTNLPQLRAFEQV